MCRKSVLQDSRIEAQGLPKSTKNIKIEVQNRTSKKISKKYENGSPPERKTDAPASAGRTFSENPRVHKMLSK